MRICHALKLCTALMLLAVLLTLPASAPAAGGGVTAPLLMRLSTRTGPGTEYDEPGTFFQSNYAYTTVRVLSRAWDSRNDIWWVQTEFRSGGQSYRAYTGLKRVNMDVYSVPEEKVLGTASTLRAAAAYWGPGTDYAASRYDIPSGTSVTVMDVENGWAQIEFRDGRVKYDLRRAWIRTENLSGTWGGGGSTALPDCGTYISRTDASDTLEVKYAGSNGITIDVFWYRLYGIDDAWAERIGPGQYRFDYDTGYEHIEGILTFSSGSCMLDIVRSDFYYIRPGTCYSYVYDGSK